MTPTPFFTIARGIHIAAGMTALAAMWIPIFARKGGRAHRKAGWVYVGAMAAVAFTGIAVSGWRLLYDDDPARRNFSYFLLYIAVLAASATSTGVRALRRKDRAAPHRGAWDLGISGLLVLAGAGSAALGIVAGQVLFIAFAPIGLLVGGSQLFYWLRAPGNRMHWWIEHMISMLTACISTITAVAVVNAPRLGLSRASLWIWIGLPAVLAVGASVWTRYYRKKFASPALAQPREARAA
jgi:uncharacterized membrane protein